MSIPAKQSCSWSFTKNFASANSDQAVTAVTLTNVKLIADLPSFNVTDPRAKYVGTWTDQCETLTDNTSEMEKVQITTSDSNRLAFTTTEYSYASSDCSGEPSSSNVSSGFMEFLGVMNLDGWGEVDRARELEADGQPDGSMIIATVRDDKLYTSLVEEGMAPTLDDTDHLSRENK